MPATDLSALRIHRDDDADRPRRGIRRLVWAVALALIAAGAWYVWRADLLPHAAPEVTVARPRLLQAGGIEETLTATGYIVPQMRSTVSARTSGRIDWLGVDDGSRVKAGQIIARLDSADLMAQVAEASATLAQSRATLVQAEATRFQADRELKRQASLVKEGITTQTDYDNARRSFDVAEAGVAAAQEAVKAADARLKWTEANLDKTIIRAPFDGIVTKRAAQVGEMVAAGAFSGQPTGGAIATVADFDSLEMEADINETNLSKVKAGQPALISADAVPDRKYRGVIRQIVPAADRQKAVLIAKVSILDKDERLMPDMSARVSFLTQALEASQASAPPRIFIPSAAIHLDGDTPFVLAVQDDKVVRLAVTLGESRGDLREATSGIKGQEALIVGGPQGLRSGDLVKVAS